MGCISCVGVCVCVCVCVRESERKRKRKRERDTQTHTSFTMSICYADAWLHLWDKFSWKANGPPRPRTDTLWNTHTHTHTHTHYLYFQTLANTYTHTHTLTRSCARTDISADTGGSALCVRSCLVTRSRHRDFRHDWDHVCRLHTSSCIINASISCSYCASCS